MLSLKIKTNLPKRQTICKTDRYMIQKNQITQQELKKKTDIKNQDTDTSYNSNSRKNSTRQKKQIISQNKDPQEVKVDKIAEIQKLSREIPSQNFFQLALDESIKTGNSIFKDSFNSLFNLYIQQEILKHYCMKTGWQFEKKMMDQIVIPSLDLLAVRREDMKTFFQPFLQKITEKYLLKTQFDNFSRLSQTNLLIQITQIWLKIKQAQINLKREIRVNKKMFKTKFCREDSKKLQIDKQKFFVYLFSDSNELKMVNVIKMYIFFFKSLGERNQRTFQQWLSEY